MWFHWKEAFGVDTRMGQTPRELSVCQGRGLEEDRVVVAKRYRFLWGRQKGYKTVVMLTQL
jgi:hypothetical protein